MTPQERQLMAQLFDRLASLENAPRDADAEAMIREGFRRAPNAAYPLVQTVLLQDEALKAANARIQEYEQQYGQPQQQQEQQQPRGFLDSMRDSLFGREEPRGSVPRVPQGGAPLGAPPGYRQDPWGQQPGYQGGAPMPALSAALPPRPMTVSRVLALPNIWWRENHTATPPSPRWRRLSIPPAKRLPPRCQARSRLRRPRPTRMPMWSRIQVRSPI